MIDTEYILELKQQGMSIKDIAQRLYENGVKDIASFKSLNLDSDTFEKHELNEIEKYLSQPKVDEDDSSFEKCKTKEDYEEYLRKFPKGKHRDEARNKISSMPTQEPKPKPVPLVRYTGKKLLNKIFRDCKERKRLIPELQEKKGYILKEDILSCLEDNHNLFGLSEMIEVAEMFSITNAEIAETLSVKEDVISDLFEYKDEPRALSRPVQQNSDESIPPCTEVYFWGVPSSGKTCALGAILRCFEKANFSIKREGESSDVAYMGDLISCFKEKEDRGYCVLPKSTYVKDLYQMRFSLRIGKYLFPFTFIDISGEACRTMSDDLRGDLEHHSDIEDKTDRESVLDNLNKLLKSEKNRKIHFFVCEHNAANKEYEGKDQSTLLSEIATYIDKHKVFNKTTDAIFLLITKADNNISQDVIKDYVQENYQSFRNTMEGYCQEHEINKGEITAIPFSIGNAFLGNYCVYDKEPSMVVIKEILESAYHDDGSIFGKIQKWFRK